MAEQIVTGLEPVRRKKGWFELTVKGKPPFYIDEETIYKNSLKVGLIFSESRLKQVKEEADKAWLKHRALDILSRRMISEREPRAGAPSFYTEASGTLPRAIWLW